MKLTIKLNLMFAVLLACLLPMQAQALPGDITLFAGSGAFPQVGNTNGDGAAATAAAINPGAVAFDSVGNVYIADGFPGRVRMVDAITGVIATVAGTGSMGVSGDGGQATVANIGSPKGLAIDASDNIYIADAANHVIRKITKATGIITTVAGTNGVPGSTVTTLNSPQGLTLNSTGTSLYIADMNNHMIRVLDTNSLVMTLAVGVGTPGFSGDNVSVPPLAELNQPTDVTWVAGGAVGILYIADKGNNRIRKADIDLMSMSTVAGTGVVGPIGDFGPATSASIVGPEGVAVDSVGNIYITNTAHDRIQVVGAASGIIATITGDGTATNTGDNGPASTATVFNPIGVTVDAGDNVYVTTFARNIRKITPDTIAPVATVVSVDGGNLTNTTAVTLTLGCTDNIACAYMQFSNDGATTWSTNVAYVSPANWTLSAAEGLKTVDARFADLTGNVSNVVSGTVTLDQTGPAAPVFVLPIANTITRSTTIPAISGTAEADATIIVKDGVSQIAIVTATGGNWVSNGAAGSISEGVHTFSAAPTDLAGNTGTVASVTYTIDISGPVITLIGDANPTVAPGVTYVDPGATALDAVHGDVSGSIVTTGNLPGAGSTAGEQYPIIYTVTDPLGNVGQAVTRFVNVTDSGGGSSAGGGSGGGCIAPVFTASASGLVPMFSLLMFGLIAMRRKGQC